MKYRHTAHLFHALMTFMTGGFWLIIWLACWASNEQHNKVVDREQLAKATANAQFVNKYKGWLNK